MYVRSFLDLEVYKLARQFARDIFEVSKSFPKEEMYSLTTKSGRLHARLGDKSQYPGETKIHFTKFK